MRQFRQRHCPRCRRRSMLFFHFPLRMEPGVDEVSKEGNRGIVKVLSRINFCYERPYMQRQCLSLSFRSSDSGCFYIPIRSSETPAVALHRSPVDDIMMIIPGRKLVIPSMTDERLLHPLPDGPMQRGILRYGYRVSCHFPSYLRS